MSDAARPRRVRPFPLAELPRLLRAQVELARVFSRHVGAALEGATPWPELAARLGGRLSVRAAEPYLLPLDRARALIREALPSAGRSVRLVEIERGAGSRAVLAIDDLLCERCGLRENAEVARAVRGALGIGTLRVAAVTPEDALRTLGEPESAAVLALDLTLELHAPGSPDSDSSDSDDAGAEAGADKDAPPAAGWARLLVGSELRLGVPPAPSPAATQRLWDRRTRLAPARVTLHIEAGYGFLPGRAVVGLAPGDVVVLDHFGPKPVTGGPVWLRLGGGAYTAHLDGAGVTLLSSFNLRAQAEAHAMTTAQDPHAQAPDHDTDADGKRDGVPTPAGRTTEPAPAQTEHLLRELPVQLTCEIGRVTLSAREVLELRPGAVLPVGRPLAGPVDLTAGGRVLARGELVDVEGEIGVRITELVD